MKGFVLKVMRRCEDPKFVVQNDGPLLEEMQKIQKSAANNQERKSERSDLGTTSKLCLNSENEGEEREISSNNTRGMDRHRKSFIGISS